MIWWEYLLVFLFGAQLTLFLHELSHVIVSKLVGWTVTGFRPWPHRHNGRWWLGRYSSSWNHDDRSPPPSSRYRHIAPMMKACFAAGLWGGFGYTIHPIFFMLMIWEIVDVLWWWLWYFVEKTGKDGTRWRKGLR